MDSLTREVREEYQHFINVVYAFLRYKHDGAVDSERIYRSMQLLSDDDRELLIEQPATRVIKIIHALMANQRFINVMLSSLSGQVINTDDEVDDPMSPASTKKGFNEARSSEDIILDDMRQIVRNSPFCRIPSEIADSDILPTEDPSVLARNMDWVRTTLRQFVRDWSDEGMEERNQSFTPLLESLQRNVPITNADQPPRVLCPGCGLGRLPYEVLELGYASQGNEISFFMLIGSYFATNFFDGKSAYRIYPYCLATSNRVKHDDQLYMCPIPDAFPAKKDKKRDFSMCTGDFNEVYGTGEHQFDAILTCFFLDTAKNPISYIRTCAKSIREGGLWANIGPLLYHYADFGHKSVELSWEELRPIIAIWFKLVKEEWREANYTSNKRSMMRTQYKCIYFEGIRNNEKVFGQSNVF